MRCPTVQRYQIKLEKQWYQCKKAQRRAAFSAFFGVVVVCESVGFLRFMLRSIPQDDTPPIVHSGRGGGEQQDTLNEPPDGHGNGGQATGEDAADQRHQQLDHTRVVKPR